MDNVKDPYRSTRLDRGFVEFLETWFVQPGVPANNIKLIVEISAYEQYLKWKKIIKMPDDYRRKKKLEEFEKRFHRLAKEMMQHGLLGPEQYGWTHKPNF